MKPSKVARCGDKLIEPLHLTATSWTLDCYVNHASMIQLDLAKASVANCTACSLHLSRTHTVFEDGNRYARVLICGEAPGETEDDTGIPFVGRAGQLLNALLRAVQLSRTDDVYICNTLKCRPPKNRVPKPSELTACADFFDTQLAQVDPWIVVAAGSTAMQTLLKTPMRISALRGKPQPWQSRVLVPVFHPSYLLRQIETRRKPQETDDAYFDRVIREAPPDSSLAVTCQDFGRIKQLLDTKLAETIALRPQTSWLTAAGTWRHVDQLQADDLYYMETNNPVLQQTKPDDFRYWVYRTGALSF